MQRAEGELSPTMVAKSRNPGGLMFSAFKANLKSRKFHEGKSRRKEKDFPLWCLKTLFCVAGVESQGGRLRGGPAAFPEQGPRKSRPQGGFAGGAGPHGSSRNNSLPCLLSAKRASDLRGHADRFSRLHSDWVTQELSFLLQRKSLCWGWEGHFDDPAEALL